jgi:kynureninase
MQALIARGVIGDYRVAPSALAQAGVAGAPMEKDDSRHAGVMRFGITPLYLRFVDVDRAVEVLEEVLRTGVWQEPRFHVRQAVT